MFCFLAVAFGDFQVRRFSQSSAHGGDGGGIANQRAQIIRRNDGGADDEIGPAGQREQRPDQKRAEFSEDEGEDEDEERDGKQRGERRLENFAEQQSDGVTGNNGDERTFHGLFLPAFSPATE